MLPYEVLVLVFSYLPPKDLDTVPLVCKAWREVASDKVWRNSFLDQFGTLAITPVSTPFHKWRREVLSRRLILQKWRRGTKDTDKTMNTSLVDATDVYLDFSSNEASVYCVNSWKGNGVAIDLENGKIRRRLFASKYRNDVLPVSRNAGSRFGIVYGFFDGTLFGTSFSRDSSYTAGNVDFAYRHSSAVTALWVAKTRGFAKPAGHSISIASGSQDGTVFLTNGVGFKSYRPVHSRVLLLEGCMHGSYTANDGESLVAVYADGSLYQFSPSANEDEVFTVKELCSLPLTDDLIDASMQLEQCNDSVIFRTRKYILVFDLVSGELSNLSIPESAEITAFALDKTFSPGSKCLVAGLSTNTVCMWSIPPSPAQSSDYTENKIVLVNARSSPKEIEAPKPFTWAPTTSVGEQRQITTSPVWEVANPIGFDSRLLEANKPQITTLATNSAVVLVGGYNGRAIAVDVLSGDTLKRIDSRIPKTVLDFSRYSRDSLVPVTHLEIDGDPNRLRGLIGVRPAIQFFDMGKAGVSKRRTASRAKRHSSKRKRRDVNLGSSTILHDMNEEMALNEEFAIIDAENDEIDSSFRENFTLNDMEDEDQFEYAMMLSQQQQQEQEQHQSENTDMDEELRQALEMSRLEDEARQLYTDPDVVPAEDEDEDEELRRAIAMSLEPENF